MFTGIVERVTKVKALERNSQGTKIKVEFIDAGDSINPGDSIAVNGVCLTVTNINDSVLTFDVMNESLKHTNLVELTNNSFVNLERAMMANARFGGHYVSGHIDFCTTVLKVTNDGFAKRINLSLPSEFQRYCIPKGSICIDGISLTLTKVEVNQFEVSIIPHTQGNTNLEMWTVGDIVNIEVDVVGKYIEKMIEAKNEGIPSRITNSFLSENGFE